MKVYINRHGRSGPWGGGNMFVKAYRKLAEQSGIVSLERDSGVNVVPDVILLAGLEPDGYDLGVESAIMYKEGINPNVKLVLRVNENDARKGTTHMDKALVTVSEFMDGTVFVSRWLQDYFNAKGWACSNQTVIVNGVDTEDFVPGPKPSDGRLHIVAHHWSDNRMKGADIYERIDQLVGERPDRYAFTYIGRHKCDFKHTKVIKPLHGKQLGEELGRHHVYVSGSLFDPGPNHVLEALACGLPTFVHVNGGGGVEFAGKAHAYRSWDELRAWLDSSDPASPRQNAETGVVRGWQPCVDEYNRFLEATWRLKNHAGS